MSQPLLNEETKTCSQCEKKMILDLVSLGRFEWRCGCGIYEQHKLTQWGPAFMRRWREANGEQV